MWAAKLLVIIAVVCLTATQAARPTNYRQYCQDFVDAHNVARAKVGVGPISWNEMVASYARRYAATRIANCNLEHSNGPYGENIVEGYGEMLGGDAMRLWVSKKPYYDHKLNKCVGDQRLRYTQVVWQNSVHLGCASVKCHNGWVFVTCNYDPPGNYFGERPY